MLNETLLVTENGISVNVCVAVYVGGEFERDLVVELQASGITASEFYSYTSLQNLTLHFKYS